MVIARTKNFRSHSVKIEKRRCFFIVKYSKFVEKYKEPDWSWQLSIQNCRDGRYGSLFTKTLMFWIWRELNMPPLQRIWNGKFCCSCCCWNRCVVGVFATADTWSGLGWLTSDPSCNDGIEVLSEVRRGQDIRTLAKLTWRRPRVVVFDALFVAMTWYVHYMTEGYLGIWP